MSIPEDLQQQVLKIFDLVNRGHCTLEAVADRSFEIAVLVASVFVCKRDGTDWTEIDSELRLLQYGEELDRERRGDYDWISDDPPTDLDSSASSEM